MKRAENVADCGRIHCFVLSLDSVRNSSVCLSSVGLTAWTVDFLVDSSNVFINLKSSVRKNSQRLCSAHHR